MKSEIKEFTPTNQSEVDVPLSSSFTPEKLSKRDLDAYEKKRQIDLKDFITRSGLRLLTCILIAMFALLIIDTIVVNFGFATSEQMSTVIDFGKYISTTLLGFLFANKNSDKDN